MLNSKMIAAVLICTLVIVAMCADPKHHHTQKLHSCQSSQTTIFHKQQQPTYVIDDHSIEDDLELQHVLNDGRYKPSYKFNQSAPDDYDNIITSADFANLIPRPC